MIKMVATWTAPREADVDDFEREYWDVHVPLAEKSPGLKKLVLTRISEGIEENPPPFYRVAELYWDDHEALTRCEQTAEWQAVREDAGRLIDRFGVELAIGVGSEDYPK